MIKFIDIHTHNVRQREDEISIVNLKENPLNYDNLRGGFFSVGIHPWNVSNASTQSLLFDICRIIQEKNIIAIGETGLDKLKCVDFQKQEVIFDTHIKFANTLQKPLIIHCVKAYNEIIRFKEKMTTPAIIHGFRGKPELVRELTKLGFYLSFGQNFNTESVAEAPLDKIFIETDNSECDITELYTVISQIKNISIEELKNTIHDNFCHIFGKII